MQRSEYDLLGHLRFQFDALGNQTEYVYDAFGRLTDKYDPDPDGPSGSLTSPHTAYTYDAAGERLTLTDPASTTAYPNVTAWTYDYLGRMVEETVYEGPPSPTSTYTSHFTYNALGDLVKKIDRENRKPSIFDCA
jgi:YD repeat-containing protein